MSKGGGKNPVKLGVRSPMGPFTVGSGKVPKIGDNTMPKPGKGKLNTPAR